MALHSSINNVLDKKLFDITSKLIHGQCNPDPLSKKAEKLPILTLEHTGYKQQATTSPKPVKSLLPVYLDVFSTFLL